MQTNKLKLYIAMSLDGFIATKDNDISWLDNLNHDGQDYGYIEFTKGISSYIIGRTTYDVVLKLTEGKFPQAEQYDCYVITRQDRKPEGGVTFYNGDIKQLIERLKQDGTGHIYCDGGGEIVKLLMQDNLIDEYIISIVPIVLGDGKRLFKGGVPRFGLEFISSESYSSGMVQVRYSKK